MSRTGAPDGPDSGPDLCVAQVPLFQGLNRDEQLQVARTARPAELAAGEQAYRAGATTAPLMVVHTGAVKLSRIDAEGNEQILRVLGPGEFIGESAFLTGRRPDHFATGLEPGRMCVFRHADLERLVQAHPSIGLRMLQTMSRRLAETEARLASVISGDVSSRLAEYLLSLPMRHGRDGSEVRLPMAKKDIASLLDTTPESLSRQLGRLRRSGVITDRGGRRLAIDDVDALMELSAQE